MCGICGIVNKRPDLDIVTICKDMTKSLIHRGPDASGYYFNKNIALGHTRLSIIDIEGGNQPLYNEDKSLVLVYNGEIYNAQSLRNELVKKEHIFSTKTDSEVVLHLFEEEGTSSFRMLDGFFAFALYDIKKDKVILSRDPYGQKPLFYTEQHGCISFASQMKPLLALVKDKQVNRDALSSIFYLGFNIFDESIFSNIISLKAGHYAIIDKKGIQVSRYTEFPFIKKERDKPVSLKELDDLLSRAISKRLISDTPVSLFLSGGIDSGLIAAYLREAGADISHFSLIPQNRFYDESANINLLVKKYGLRHEFIPVSDIREEDFEDLVLSIEEPLTDPTSILTQIISRSVGHELGFKVAISGMGGDELFLGYRRLLLASMIDRIPRGCISTALSGMAGLSRGMKAFFPFLSGGRETGCRNMMRWGTGFIESSNLSPFDAYFKIRDQFRNRRLTSDDKGIVYKKGLSIYNDISDQTLLNRLLIFEILTNLKDSLLKINDRIGMRYSLEIRQPFLDLELARFLFSYPDKYKFTRHRLKPLLKKIARRKLPVRYINSPKKGFDISLSDYFRGKEGGFIYSLLSRKNLNRHNLLDTNKVLSLLDEHKSGKLDNSRAIFTLIQFQIWFDRFLSSP